MANLGVTLYQHMLQQQAQQSAEARASKERDKQAKRDEWDQVFKQQQFLAEQKERDFNRQVKLAEMAGQASGHLGKDAPAFEAPAVQEHADVGRMLGLAERKGVEEKFDFQRDQEEADFQRGLFMEGIRGDRHAQELELKKKLAAEDLLMKQLGLSRADARAESERQFKAQEAAKERAARYNMFGQKMKQDEAKLQADISKEKLKQTGDLRQEIQKQEPFKQLQDVSLAYGKLKKASDHPMGDLAMVINYMKMLDPGSTVREGEFKSVRVAQSVLDYMNNYLRQVAGGRLLTPNQRKQILEEAKAEYDSHVGGYNEWSKQYQPIAERQGLPWEDVYTGVPAFKDEELDTSDLDALGQ